MFDVNCNALKQKHYPPKDPFCESVTQKFQHIDSNINYE